MQGIAWGLIAFAFMMGIMAPPPTPPAPSERFFTTELRETMANYCRRYPASYFDQCMRRKAQDWHVVR